MAGRQAVQEQDDAEDQETEQQVQDKPVDEKAGQDEDFTIIETDDAGRPLAGDDDERDEANTQAGEGEEDERVLARGGRVESVEDRRARRKLARKNRRERDKRANVENRRLREENAELRRIAERVGNIEGSVGQISVAAIDGRLTELSRVYKAADADLVDAIGKGDGERASKALSARGQAEREFHELKSHRDEVTKAPDKREMTREASQPLSADVEERISSFSERHPWYNVAKPMSDPDSAVVLSLDHYIVAQGFKPNTDEYWEELEDLMEERLPHRFGEERRQNGDARPNGRRPAPRRGGPPVGGGGGDRPLGPNEVVITPARKAAMVDAGIWDDPERRKKQLKAYRDYDKVHGPPGRGA